MPVTDEYLENMILNVDSDKDYFYEVDLATMIEVGEECDFETERKYEKYEPVLVKNLKKITNLYQQSKLRL